jgi:MFS family permease
MIGLSLAWFALGAAAYLSDSTVLVLAGAFADGAGLVWLVAVTGTAIQRYTPPRLQGRAKAAWTMVAITPQTVSIAVGAALISYLSYRVMLLAVIAVVGACAMAILIHPVPDPLDDAAPAGTAAERVRDSVLPGREAEGAVEADDLAVEVIVLDDALDHGRVLRRPAHPAGVRDLRAPVGLELVA